MNAPVMTGVNSIHAWNAVKAGDSCAAVTGDKLPPPVRRGRCQSENASGEGGSADRAADMPT